MTADPKLIEAVARAIDPEWWEPGRMSFDDEPCPCKDCVSLRDATRGQAAAALAAINASGEWWLVERKKIDGIANEFYDVPPELDSDALGFHDGWERCARVFHGALRTAYLAKTEERR
jgi:hypothetical protein